MEEQRKDKCLHIAVNQYGEAGSDLGQPLETKQHLD